MEKNIAGDSFTRIAETESLLLNTLSIPTQLRLDDLLKYSHVDSPRGALTMAKSARASVTKRNHRNLRAKVFGPAHDARTARLSAKLQELAAKPRPETDKSMDVDASSEKGREEQRSTDNVEGIFTDLNTQNTCADRRNRNGPRLPGRQE